MPLTIEQFVQPVGELTASMFPGVTLATYIDVWITDAAAASDDADTQVAYVYVRAYGTLVDRLMLEPQAETRADASARRGDAQLAYWRQKLAAWQARYDRLTSNTGGGITLTAIGFST